MKLGDGDSCPELSGGRSNDAAFGADVATTGLVFGPECPGEEAERPSVISGRANPRGDTLPGVGYVPGPGLASRNALCASSRQSFTSASEAAFSANAAPVSSCIAMACSSGPHAASRALRCQCASSISEGSSANGWYFATSSGW